jgi:large subunit ribosomal protein L23
MIATEVIRRPLVTEKTSHGSGANRYAFEVDRRSTKTDIRRAVEEIYKVRVLKVATLLRKGRVRRYRYGATRLADVKHAVVRIHPEDRIELF